MLDVVRNFVRSNSIRLDTVIDYIPVTLTDKTVKPIIILLPAFTEEIPHPNLVLFLSEIEIKAGLTVFAWIQSAAKKPGELGKYTYVLFSMWYWKRLRNSSVFCKIKRCLMDLEG